MIRKHFYLTKDQNDFLEYISKTTVSVSEHIRNAIDEYIDRKRKEGVHAQVSPSKMKVFHHGKEVEWKIDNL